MRGSGEPRGGAPPAVAALIQSAEGHPAYDAAEEEHRGTILDFLRSAPRPFDRNDFEPGHVVGSACVVSPGDDVIVLVNHARLGRWLQPGGHVEPAEDGPLAAAVRETEEETGLDLDPQAAELLDLDVHRIPDGREPSHLHFDFRYLFTAEGRPLTASSDARAARWVTSREAGELGLDEGLVRILDKCAERGLLRP